MSRRRDARAEEKASAKRTTPRPEAGSAAARAKSPDEQALRAALVGQLHTPARPPAPRDLLQLQRAIGNRAVGKLLARTARRPPPLGGGGGGRRLPDDLRAGAEALSGVALDDVRVHYNSSRPAAVEALAFTRGAEIHLAPGQEKHLAHEAWHVVQQRRGRVRPTKHAGGVALNDDAALEREADSMGARAAARAGASRETFAGAGVPVAFAAPPAPVIQRRPIMAAEIGGALDTKRTRAIVGEGTAKLIVADPTLTADTYHGLFVLMLKEIRRVGSIVRTISKDWKTLGDGIDPLIYRIRARNTATDVLLEASVQFSKNFTGYINEVTITDGEGKKQQHQMVNTPAMKEDEAGLVALFSDIYSTGHDPEDQGTIFDEIAKTLNMDPEASSKGVDALTQVLGEGARFECVSNAYEQGLFGNEVTFFTEVTDPEKEFVAEARSWLNVDDVRVYAATPFERLWLQWNKFGKDYGISDARVAHVLKVGAQRGALPEQVAKLSKGQQKDWAKQNLPAAKQKLLTGKDPNIFIIYTVAGTRPKGYDLDAHVVRD